MSNYFGKIARNRFAATFMTVCLLAVILVPLVEQVITSSAVLYGILDNAQDTVPEEEETEKSTKYLVQETEWQPVLTGFSPLAYRYEVTPLSSLSKVFIPPPEL